ncbi:hypothetical protein KC324_g20518, partial [Hortaea werneckii]
KQSRQGLLWLPQLMKNMSQECLRKQMPLDCLQMQWRRVAVQSKASHDCLEVAPFGVEKDQECLQALPDPHLVSVPPASRQDRPQSIDTTSIKSTDSGGWAAALFSSSNKRHDSRTTKEPVELATQHDKDQLPPTLSKRPADPQDAAWNKFLMKLAVSRSQSGNSDQANGIGLVGASHFGQEGKLGEQKMKTLTQLVIGGIPMTLRHNLWMELSNTEALMEPGTYSYYLSLREDVDQSEIDAIAKDVPRTLTSVHQYYANQGDKRLKEVLVAFVSKYESLGYTQGLNTIAGYLC